MSIRSWIRLGFALTAIGFTVDGGYALYRGDAINSAGVVMDVTAILFCTLGAFMAPLFFQDGDSEPWHKLDYDEVDADPAVDTDERKRCDVHRTIAALQVVLAHECLTDEQRQVLGDIAKGILINKGEES